MSNERGNGAFRVAVVGAGASGVLVAIHLLRQAREPIEILLVDDSAGPGRGIAYETRRPEHLLNVTAPRLSALPNEPTHFLGWLGAQGVRISGRRGIYPPRGLFGDYLASMLESSIREASSEVRFRRIPAEAVSLRITDGRGRIGLASGETLEADRVALALGYGRRDSPLSPAIPAERLIGDPWSPGALDRLPTGGDLLVIGTGQTMIDVALTYIRAGGTGTIHAVSRHGLLPRSHPREGHPTVFDLPAEGRIRLRPLVRRVRREIADLGKAGLRWTDLLDALRFQSAGIWLRLDERDRRLFLRHLQPWWNVHRHRTAPIVAHEIGEMIESKRLVIHAGKVARIESGREGLRATILRRGGEVEETLEVPFVVDATGLETDWRRDRRPLVRQLLGDGLVRIDPLALGLDATTDGFLVDSDGRPSPILATLGPPLRGILWETVAIREIREQAERLASRWTEEARRRRAGG
jgi:uncharacterized NAD(P)/FAD-binding protein YdhS